MMDFVRLDRHGGTGKNKLTGKSLMVKRMASHNLGANCHSSINTGGVPANKSLGLTSAIRRFCRISEGSFKKSTVAARWAAVVLFPHHLGPSIKTAPTPASLRSNILSAILCLYAIYKSLIISAKIILFSRISQVGAISFPKLTRFHFLSWQKHVVTCSATTPDSASPSPSSTGSGARCGRCPNCRRKSARWSVWW